MLVIFQFPISDARSFDPDVGLRLAVPDWPNPNTEIKPQFVHHFGRTVERRHEVDEAWPDEIKFCKAKRALRFDDLARHPAGLPGARLRPKCAFRRLFCDGQAVVRVEVGIAHNPRAPRLVSVEAHQILSIVSGLCELPTLVPETAKPPAINKLLRQGPALARLYASSTLSRSAPQKAKQAQALVEAGNPLIVVELAQHESSFPFPPEGFLSVPAEEVLGVNVAFGRLSTRVGPIRTWVLQCGNATQHQSRMLRLCLMRLHAEQETLDLVLKQIHRKRLLNPPDPSIVDEIDAYFNQKIRLIDRAEWGGIGQSAVLAAFDAAEEVTPPATRQNLIDRYTGARRQVWKKIEEYQIRRASIRVVPVVNVSEGGYYVDKSVTINQSGTGNIANVAEFMSQVTNQVTNNLEKSSSTDEVKALVKKLGDQITAISSSVDPKQTQRMGSDLQTLSNEMAQPEPRKAWYELSLKGLKEAAEAVGEIAGPIVATVSKLLPLLVG